MLRIATLAALACEAGNLAAIQSTTLQLSEYQKRDWQVEDGLPDNNLRMIAQKPDGTLILATSSGIASFDGQRFRVLPINDASKAAGITDDEAVNAILPEGNDDLWIGTDGRGVLRQTRSGTVDISEQAGFFNERIRLIYRDTTGVLWIASQNGVERFVHGHLERVAGTGMISGDITTPFAEDGHGGMFFVTSSGLFYWRNGVAHRYALQLPVPDWPVAAYRDSQNRIWIGTAKHVVQLVPKNSTARDVASQYTQEVRAAVAGPVTVLLGDATGNLWIGTRHNGLWRLTPSGVSQWSTRNGLPDDSIRSLFIDDEQSIWIGMLSGGLSRWRKGALVPYGDQEGFHANYAANVLADSRGDLWLGTWGKGLFRIHNGERVSISPPTMPITTPIRALAEDRNGRIWVGTWFNGIYCYDGHSFHHYLLGNESPGNAVSAILTDKVGGMWVGTYTGLLHFSGGTPDPRHSEQLLDSLLVTCLLEDTDRSILVGTSTGLYRIRKGSAAPVATLAHLHILSLTLDSRGYVWASTQGGGLAAIRGESAIPVPSGAGLSNGSVNSVIEDNDGHLWLGTLRGIVRISVDELHAVVDGRQAVLSSLILNKADGMRSSECAGPSQPASTKQRDGTLWFATTKGFVHTTDVAEKLDAPAPVAAIVGWTPSIDPNSVELLPTATSSRIQLVAGQPDLLLFFNAKLLANPAQVEFRYRLAGYDAGWTMTRSRIAHYRHLPPGNYRFEVQARGSGEGWTSPVAAVIVTQNPFIYQTWYFYLALLLLAVAITMYLFHRRVQLMKSRMGIVLEERNRIAREWHDTLMADFAAVSWQLEATAKLFSDNNTQSSPPAESCQLARRMVTHCQAEARRIIWDLRDTDEATDSLSQALTRALSAMPAPEAIDVTFKVEGHETPQAPVCVHHLVCIGQEAVGNAIRHAQASHITIKLRYESDALTLTIRDDGCGFQYQERIITRSGHFGISVMEERARKLGSRLRLRTTVGSGTEVTVRIELSAVRQLVHKRRRFGWRIGI